MTTEVLSKKTLYAHGTLGMPLAVIGYPLAIWIPAHYSGGLGISLATVGTILMLARLTDVITDPLMESYLTSGAPYWPTQALADSWSAGHDGGGLQPFHALRGGRHCLLPFLVNRILCGQHHDRLTAQSMGRGAFR